MKPIVLFFIGLTGISSIVGAATEGVLTREQRADVEGMIAADRVALYEMVRLEICADVAREGVVPTICKRTRDLPASQASESRRDGGFLSNSTISAPDTMFVSADRKPPLVLDPIGNATTDRAVADGKERIEFTTSTASSKASLQLGHAWSRPDRGGIDRFSTLGVTLSAPLDKQNDDTTIATLDGFANAAALTLAYTNFYATGRRNPYPDGVPTPELARKLTAIGLVPEDGEIIGLSEIEAQLAKLDRLDSYAEFRELFWKGSGWAWTNSLSASVGHETFAFHDPVSLSKDDTSRAPWSVGVFAGVLPAGMNTFFNAGIEFEHSYEAGRARTFCPTETTGAPVECTNGHFGPPTAVDRNLASIEMRSAINRHAFSLKVTRDFKNHESGVDLPVYLFRDNKSGLNGGLRLGWTDTDAFTFGIFVGSDFGLIP